MQKTITLDMNFLPTRISVAEKKTPLLAGEPQTFTCSALGSRPPATITWWLDNKRIDGGEQQNKNKAKCLLDAIETPLSLLHCHTRNEACMRQPMRMILLLLILLIFNF